MGKISTNTNLKRRIREFQAQHGVSHSIASKAVDEPLHILRDLSRIPQSMATPDLNEARFRLVGDQSRFARFHQDYSEAGARYIRDIFAQYQSMSSPSALMKLISRRFEVIEEAGGSDLWELRERVRAGLIIFPELIESPSAIAPSLVTQHRKQLIEPLFYWHEGELDSRVAHYLSQGEGTRLGIFPLNMQGILELNDPGESAAIPITFEESGGLLDGSLQHKPRFLQRFSQKSGWTVEQRSYSVLAELKENWGESQVRVFFGHPEETLESARLRLQSMGLDPLGFELRDIRGEQLTLHYAADRLEISGWQDGRSISMRTERTIELDGELAARAYEDARRTAEDRRAAAMRGLEELTKISRMRLVPDSFAAPLESYSLVKIWEKGYMGTCPFCGARQSEHDLATTPFRVNLDSDWYGCRACDRSGAASQLPEDYRRAAPGEYIIHRWDAPDASYSDILKGVRDTVGIRSYMEFEGIKTYDFKHEELPYGDCPFYDSTPHELTINPERRTFFCFGCGESGDIVSFVEKYKKLSFREALDYLQAFELKDGKLMKRSSRAPKL